MRRRIVGMVALGLMTMTVGCHITTGVCDCVGIEDPCGGPPLPFYSVPGPGPGEAVIADQQAAPGVSVQQAPVAPQVPIGSETPVAPTVTPMVKPGL